MVRGLALTALAVFAWWRGNPDRAAIAAAAAVALTVAALVFPAFGPLLDRGAARLGHWASALATGFGALLVELFIGLPGRLFSLFRRRDPITGAERGASTTWRDRVAGDDQPARPYDADVPRRRPGRQGRRRPLSIIGIVASIIAVDLLLGSVFNGALTATPLRVRRLTTPVERGLPMARPPAALLAGPALQGAPWAADCYRDLDTIAYLYTPFLVVQPQDHQGTCVNVQDHHRVSWEPTARGTLPVVWFFGGSAVFGDGQRDGHTIASEYARQAAAAGHPVQVENFGTPGFTAMQEALLLEQLLSVRAAPAQVVLYDGANDVVLHQQYPGGQPTAFPTTVKSSPHPGGRESLWEQWQDHSALHRVWHWLSGQTTAQAADLPPSPTAIGRQTVGVYDRSLRLARRVAAAHHVPLAVFFQPARLYDAVASATYVRTHLPAGVTDLSHAIDATTQPTWIDGVHLNEEGARLVARQILVALGADAQKGH